MNERAMTILAWGVSVVLVLVGLWARFFPTETAGAGCAACPPTKVIVAVVHTGATAPATIESLDVYGLDCGPSSPPATGFPGPLRLDPEVPSE